MIKLEEVYAEEIMDYKIPDEIKSVIKSNNVKSIKDILELQKFYSNFNWTETLLVIDYIKSIIDKSNNKGIEPQIFMTPGYDNLELNRTDGLNRGDVLLLYSVTNVNPTSSYGVKDISILTIKEWLSHVTSRGENYFMSKNKKLGEMKIKNLVSAIIFYEEQVKRQAYELENSSTNLFEEMINERRKITEDNIEEIARYLISKTKKEFIWGKANEQTKKEILSAVINNSNKDIQIRENLIRFISNYTTYNELKELESGNKKILERFLIK